MACVNKNRFRRGIFLRLLAGTILFFALPSAALFAQKKQEPFWLTLEEGKRFFRSGEYGEALRCFEQARIEKKNKYSKVERELITVLSIHEVRLLKDDLGLVEMYIQKENRTASASALNELYYTVPRFILGNSASKALAETGRLKEYPEAEYWIGEVYRAEGEFTIALSQYRKAYGERELFENPGFTVELLYKMADLHRLRGEDEEMVKRLEEILGTDEGWKAESFSRTAMVSSAVNNGLNRFLVLYRNNKAVLEKAHRQLGIYYYSSGRHERALEHLLVSFLIRNTVLIEKLKQEQYDYSFSSLEKLFDDIAVSRRETRRQLENYMTETEYFSSFYYLGNAFYGNGRTSAAREAWAFLRDRGQGEWKTRAAAQLSNPRLESTITGGGREQNYSQSRGP